MNWKQRQLTPAIKELAIKFATRDVKNLQDGVNLIQNNLKESMEEGFNVAFESIDAIKSAKGGKQLGSDDDIAKLILEEIKKRTNK